MNFSTLRMALWRPSQLLIGERHWALSWTMLFQIKKYQYWDWRSYVNSSFRPLAGIGCCPNTSCAWFSDENKLFVILFNHNFINNKHRKRNRENILLILNLNIKNYYHHHLFWLCSLLSSEARVKRLPDGQYQIPLFTIHSCFRPSRSMSCLTHLPQALISAFTSYVWSPTWICFTVCSKRAEFEFHSCEQRAAKSFLYFGELSRPTK